MAKLQIVTTVSEQETQIESRAQLLISTASRMVIDSSIAMERGADTAKNLKSLAKKAEDERVRLVKPIKEAAKEIDERFKVIITPLTTAAKVVESKMFTFTKEQERIAREEQAARQKAEEDMRQLETEEAEETQSALPIAIPNVHTIAAIAVPEITRGVMGSTASIRKTWTFEVLDIVALANARPDLVEAVSARINAEIRGQGGEIAGLRIFQQESMRVR